MFEEKIYCGSDFMKKNSEKEVNIPPPHRNRGLTPKNEEK